MFPHIIADQDAFIPDLLGYWAVETVLKEDLASKDQKLEELRAIISNKPEFEALSPEE